MNVPTKLAAFGVVLVIVFALSFGIGSAVSSSSDVNEPPSPQDTQQNPAAPTTTNQHGDGGH